VTVKPEFEVAMRARTLAEDWHDGQWSAMYALASSGTVVTGLAREFRRCATMTDDRVEMMELLEAAEWAEQREPEGE